MKDFSVALQLYSVRDDLKADFEGTLRAVKAMGYDGVEFAGLCGKSGKEIKELCRTIGLVPVSAHVPFVDMINDLSVLDTYAEIGCQYVAIPYLTPEYRPGQPQFAEVIEGAKMLMEKAKSLGIQLCYHNHDFEFVRIDGTYAIDVLYREVPELLPEFDTCWIKVAGEDPVNYIQTYADRIQIVHLKDFAGQKSENMYALIGIDDDQKKDAVGKFEFRPLGCGVQNFDAVLDVCRQVKAKWVVVEQDSPSMGKTPMQCAYISLKYLNNCK